MAVQSKFLVPGKKYLANKWYCTLYSNIEKDITASLNSHLFYSPPPLLKISKCNSKRCFTCPDVSSSQCDNDPNLATFCKAYNVIYKISYNICNTSYVGETSTPLHLRINQHSSDSNKFDSFTNYNKSTVDLKS